MTDKARALQEKKQKLAAKKELRASGDAAQAASATPPESPGKTDKALALERKKADLAARKAARASGSQAEAPAPAAAAAPPESPGSSNFEICSPLKTFFLLQNIFFSTGKTDKALALERKKADLAARKAARASGSHAEAPASGTNSRMNSISFSNSFVIFASRCSSGASGIAGQD